MPLDKSSFLIRELSTFPRLSSCYSSLVLSREGIQVVFVWGCSQRIDGVVNTIICIYVSFVGDTLLTATCGKFFEGTAEQMHRALFEILGKLPPETVYNCSCMWCVQL